MKGLNIGAGTLEEIETAMDLFEVLENLGWEVLTLIRFLVQSVRDVDESHVIHQNLMGLSRTLMNSVMNKYENMQN